MKGPHAHRHVGGLGHTAHKHVGGLGHTAHKHVGGLGHTAHGDGTSLWVAASYLTTPLLHLSAPTTPLLRGERWQQDSMLTAHWHHTRLYDSMLTAHWHHTRLHPEADQAARRVHRQAFVWGLLCQGAQCGINPQLGKTSRAFAPVELR